LGSSLDGYQFGQVANSFGAAADSSEQPDRLVVRTGRDHAEGQRAGGIAGGDTCENRRRDHSGVTSRAINELEADVGLMKESAPSGALPA